MIGYQVPPHRNLWTSSISNTMLGFHISKRLTNSQNTRVGIFKFSLNYWCKMVNIVAYTSKETSSFFFKAFSLYFPLLQGLLLLST